MVVKIFDWRTSTLLDFSWCVARIRRVAQNVNYPQLSQGASTLIIGLRLSVGVVLGWLTHSPYPTQRSSRRLALGQHRPRCAPQRGVPHPRGSAIQRSQSLPTERPQAFGFIAVGMGGTRLKSCRNSSPPFRTGSSCEGKIK